MQSIELLKEFYLAADNGIDIDKLLPLLDNEQNDESELADFQEV